jgi:uncharacterized iron-regulated membrane protein
MNYRNLLFSLHCSIGLLLGLLLIFISFSGTGIVFQKKLDQAIDSALWKVTLHSEQVSLDSMTRSVFAAHQTC